MTVITLLPLLLARPIPPAVVSLSPAVSDSSSVPSRRTSADAWAPRETSERRGSFPGSTGL